MRMYVLCSVVLVMVLSTPVRTSDDGRLSRLEDQVAAMTLYIGGQEDTIRSLKTHVQDLAKRLDENTVVTASSASSRAKRDSVNVAFSSYLDHTVSHVGIDSIVNFNKLILNDGMGFNNITGIFTVPVSGVYLFTYTINTSVDALHLMVKLVVDGVNISDAVSNPWHHGQGIQGGNTVLVRVNTGQSVWVAVYDAGNTIVDGRETHRFTTFSGVLLYT